MGAIAVPILPGKLEMWKEWAASLKGDKKQEWEDFNKRYNLTRHRSWLQANPDGGHLVIVLNEGPGADGFMPSLGQSSHAFDVSFRDNIKEVHGMDVTQPPPGPAPELTVDYSSA